MTPVGSPAVRPPAVAGSFYPATPERLAALVRRQLEEADPRFPGPPGLPSPVGLLVPHAGLEFSGVVAAAAWRTIARTAATDHRPLTIVILGTNHRAAWLDGIGIWDEGAWRTPLGDVAVDTDLAGAIEALGPPFVVDRDAHSGEHSIEVQLPFVQALEPAARLVALAVSTGIGDAAIEAGARLGALVASRERTRTGARVILAISSDMAHYPAQPDAAAVTSAFLPALTAIDAALAASAEIDVRERGIPGLACGMCGIEPAVVGLAALRATGASAGTLLAAATSAEAGAPPDRTVGYLALRFD
jgi:AmmeMemoRadiSam system protein B